MAIPIDPFGINPLTNDPFPQTMAQPGADTAAASSTAAVVTTSTAAVETSATEVTTTSASPTPSTTSTTQAVETTTQATSTTPTAAPPPSTTSQATSSAIPQTTSTSVAPVVVTTTSSSSTPPTTSTTQITTSSSTTSSSASVITITSTQPHPSLITDVTASPITSTSSHVSSAAASSTPKSGFAHTGLPLGAFVGIIIGGIAVIALIAMIVTRSIRKKGRARRTANRSSMFEPWPAQVPVSMEDEPYEKPSEYPMGETAGTQELSYADNQYPTYPPDQYADYPAQPQNVYPQYNENVGAPPSEAAPLVGGIHDGMMVRVKIGFVRSLEDELAVIPGQQLYLHTAYDDGWSLCEDQNQARGVVPLSCLEPWQENSLMPRSNTDKSLSGRSERRSSLYQTTGTSGQYLNAP